MMTLVEARTRVGAEVRYHPYPGARSEVGEIVAVNDSLVFVLYLGDRTAKATRPEDLTLVEPDPCVICGSFERSEQGGLCPAHTYDEGDQSEHPADSQSGDRHG